ncbi:MAG: PQQ-binding-like beta-propeller repeat protein [Planctomycetes bacterium]|nr:PQQ-binding-like beta-propeller repeat protein [Planctomycetota bacterium]
MRWIAVVAAAIATGLPAQTEAEVRGAVEQYFADDAERVKAREQLRSWGDAALPHLRAIANSRAAERLGWEIVCAIKDIRSDAATDAWVEVLLGRTKVEAEHARNALTTQLRHEAVRSHLEGHAAFRTAIFALAESKSFLERGYFIDTAVAMEWHDAVPAIRRMTSDIDPGLRKRAAAAIARLTQEEVEVAKTPAVFRGRRIVKDLLDGPDPLPAPEVWTKGGASFTRWFDGAPCLLYGDGKGFCDLDSERCVALEQHGQRLLSLPAADGNRIFVALVSDSKHGGPDYAIGVAAAGKVLWQFTPPKLGIGDGAVLYDSGGAYGCALGFGSDAGVVALDADGNRIWDFPQQLVYRLASDPRLPGSLLLVAGDSTVLSHTRDDRRPRRTTIPSTPAFRFATDGVLFPDDAGKPAVILVGSSESDSIVARFDAAGKLVWRGILSDRAGGIAAFPTRRFGQLYVLTTEDGGLHVIDADGVLRWQGELPNPKADDTVATYLLAAGEAAPGVAAIVVKLLTGYYIYHVQDG